ncbi:hypothetical protein [Bacillus cereus]
MKKRKEASPVSLMPGRYYNICINIPDHDVMIDNTDTAAANKPVLVVGEINRSPSDPLFRLQEQWMIHRFDDFKYMFVNRFTGQMAVNRGNQPDILYTCDLFEDYSPSMTRWTIENIDNTIYYKIRSGYDGNVMIDDTGLGLDSKVSLVEDSSQLNGSEDWIFEADQEFRVPEKPKLETLESFPQYKKATDNLPKMTIPRLTGWVLMPSNFVFDGIWSSYAKINYSPYYILEKYQYWTQIMNLSLLPKETITETFVCGTTSDVINSMDKTLKMSVTKDFGLNFTGTQQGITPGGDYGLIETTTKSLNMHQSLTEEEVTTVTTEYTIDNPFDTTLLYAKYILTTKFVYKRVSPNPKDPDIEIESWELTDPNTLHATCFPSKGPSDQKSNINDFK